MSKFLSASLKLVAIAALAAFTWSGYHLYSLGQPVKSYEITKGKAGAFLLGEAKDAILARLPEQEYALGADAGTCGTAWIKVKSMSSWQRRCLLVAPQWQVGAGIPSLCPGHADAFATLHFHGNNLQKVGIRCLQPE